MFVAALLDCFDNKSEILRDLQVNICNNMTLSADNASSYERQGILFKATDSSFDPNSHIHIHRNLKDAHAFINETAFSDEVKSAAKGVYEIIARAESQVHCESVESVHFHEVGSKRAIACIVCACALVDRLNPDEIVFSAINTGYGKVICAHGEVDVPAPATRVILNDIPTCCAPSVEGEICTPTGAALASFFADSFISLSALQKLHSQSDRTGTGLGSRDLGIANGIRVFLHN